jgi:isopenicillin N synthase-like dioxygenase
MNAVPVIDLAPARGGRADRLAVARAIDAACREIGFFAVRGHGVPEALVHDLRGRAHEFFALPLADKLAARHPVPGTNRGYHPVGGETLASANDAAAPPDLKEFFHVGPVDVSRDAYYTGPRGRAHFAPNIWPLAPAGFEAAATAYYRTMSGLIIFLMRLCLGFIEAGGGEGGEEKSGDRGGMRCVGLCSCRGSGFRDPSLAISSCRLASRMCGYVL